MTRNLGAKIDELYGLPLEEFTKARNALAKTLTGRDKKDVTSLAKPSLPAWVINQIYFHDAPTYKALIDAAEKLRSAHRAALSGRTTDTRKPDQLHRATVEKAFAKAIATAEKRGVRLTDSVRDAVRRTLAALPGDEPAGRLTHPPAPAGFSLLAGIKVQSPKSKAQSPKPTVQRLEREKKEAEQKAQKEQMKREREILKAEQALKDAERRLAELKR